MPLEFSAILSTKFCTLSILTSKSCFIFSPSVFLISIKLSNAIFKHCKASPAISSSLSESIEFNISGSFAISTTLIFSDKLFSSAISLNCFMYSFAISLFKTTFLDLLLKSKKLTDTSTFPLVILLAICFLILSSIKLSLFGDFTVISLYLLFTVFISIM